MPYNPPSHFLRLGSHAEKQYFLDQTELYDGIIFNANLVAITTAACASLASTLREKNKALLLDPWTYVYGLEGRYLLIEKSTNGETERYVKSSYAKLADVYGEPVSSAMRSLDEEPYPHARLTPSQFEGKIQAFTNRVLAYERTSLREEMEEDAYFGEEAELLRPDALIPPYFYASGEEWLDLNLRCLDASLKSEEREGLPIVPVICIPHELLASISRRQLIEWLERYRGRDCDGFVLWVSGFDETFRSVGILEGFLDAVQTLCNDEKDRPVINAYGGYFSVAAMSAGLSGFSHSVGYGESKEAEPPSGGPPAPKYYFRPMHTRIEAETAVYVVQDRFGKRKDEEGSVVREEDLDGFYQHVCDCVVCQQLVEDGLEGFADYAEAEKSDKPNLPPHIRDRKYATGRAKRLNNEHYLHARQQEIDSLEGLSRDEAASELWDGYQGFEETFGHVPEHSSTHLSRWAEALAPPREDETEEGP